MCIYIYAYIRSYVYFTCYLLTIIAVSTHISLLLYIIIITISSSSLLLLLLSLIIWIIIIVIVIIIAMSPSYRRLCKYLKRKTDVGEILVFCKTCDHDAAIGGPTVTINLRKR